MAETLVEFAESAKADFEAIRDWYVQELVPQVRSPNGAETRAELIYPALRDAGGGGG